LKHVDLDDVIHNQAGNGGSTKRGGGGNNGMHEECNLPHLLGFREEMDPRKAGN